MTKCKKLLSQKSYIEQVIYHINHAYSWLMVGAPCTAGDSLKLAINIVEFNLNKTSKLYTLLCSARTAAFGPSPRSADFIIKDILNLPEIKKYKPSK